MLQATIYTSRTCGYCFRAKRLLESKGVEYTEYSVDGDMEARMKLMQVTGRRTVPQVWVGETHVGGCDDLFALERSGKLDGLLNPQA